MDSTARFLLGGALGAALGFLISQKNLEKALRGAQPAGAPTMSVGVPGAAPAAAEDLLSAVAAPVMAPPAAPARPTLAPTRPTVVPIVPAATPTWPAPVAAPPVISAPTPVDTAAESPVASEPAWRIASAPPLAPEPPVERTAPSLAPAPPLAPEQPVSPEEPVAAEPEWESEVIVTREFLEEPVPGSGWASKATPAISEDELQDVVPLVSDLVLPYAGPEIESSVTEARASRPTLVWPEPFSEPAIEDLSTAAEPVFLAVTEPAVELLVEPVVEAPEEAIVELSDGEVLELEEEVAITDDGVTDELVVDISGPGTTEIESLAETTQFPQTVVEEPVDEELAGEGQISQPPEPELVIVADEGDAGPTVMEALVETASVESASVELPVVDELLELPAEELVVEELPLEEAVVEELPVEEAPVAETAPAVSDEPPADIARVDDLKSRIEETRRRIRRELEQPFDTEEETQEAEPDWTVLPVVPATSAPAELAPAEVAPVFAEPEAPAAVEPEPPEVEVIYPGEPEEPVDYESMKSRIEVTRSRLKAKAFDAMMTGESALLGRDAEGSDRNRSAPPSVDTEVDETIESSLREEEE
jgi:hypothetical protein